MIELKNIAITFNPGTADENAALKNIDLTINKGDFITVSDRTERESRRCTMSSPVRFLRLPERFRFR